MCDRARLNSFVSFRVFCCHLRQEFLFILLSALIALQILLVVLKGQRAVVGGKYAVRVNLLLAVIFVVHV